MNSTVRDGALKRKLSNGDWARGKSLNYKPYKGNLTKEYFLKNVLLPTTLN